MAHIKVSVFFSKEGILFLAKYFQVNVWAKMYIVNCVAMHKVPLTMKIDFCCQHS